MILILACCLGITDALLTMITIVLLFAYTGLHFYIRFLFDRSHSSTNFIYITVRVVCPLWCQRSVRHLLASIEFCPDHVHFLPAMDGPSHSYLPKDGWERNVMPSSHTFLLVCQTQRYANGRRVPTELAVLLSISQLSLLTLKISHQQQWMVISIGLLLMALWFTMARDLVEKNFCCSNDRSDSFLLV
jgi:hypothetical protein